MDMRELIKYSFLAKIRDLSLVFWPLVFPLVLTTAMYISIGQMEESEIIPSFGYFITKGLSDAVRQLVRDSGLGAKIYVDRIPFAGKTFDLGRKYNIDPVSAALNGGDDFRILYTIPIGKHDRFRHDFQTFDIIGHLARPEVGAVLVTPDGVELPLRAQGWKSE